MHLKTINSLTKQKLMKKNYLFFALLLTSLFSSNFVCKAFQEATRLTLLKKLDIRIGIKKTDGDVELKLLTEELESRRRQRELQG